MSNQPASTRMQYHIHGHHLNVGDALKTHIQDKLDGINEKYFNRGIEATITLTKDSGSLYKTNIVLKGGRDLVVQADSDAHDPYGSFEEAAEKVAKQLRRYKRRIRDDHHRVEDKLGEAMQQAQSYILAATAEPANDADEDHFEAGEEPLIIAESTTNIQTLSVSDAVMRMELSDANAMMFRNSQNKRLNVVYKRKDGNIGWVDPAEK